MATGKRVFAVKPADLKAAEKLTKEIGQRIQKLHNIMARTTGLRPWKLSPLRIESRSGESSTSGKRCLRPKEAAAPYNPNPMREAIAREWEQSFAMKKPTTVYCCCPSNKYANRLDAKLSPPRPKFAFVNCARG